jgi:hypothetical protein
LSATGRQLDGLRDVGDVEIEARDGLKRRHVAEKSPNGSPNACSLTRKGVEVEQAIAAYSGMPGE